jgi:hypothetical protein
MPNMSSDPCRVGPDADLTGLGVRMGLYMQCIALSIAAVTGFERTLTVILSAIMTALVLNIILAMKASVQVFNLAPTVQDFWVAQTQLFLLTTIVPFTMLFGRWNDLGRVKNVLALLTVPFTYVQAFWFWFTGYEQSDELVCSTAESELGYWKLFSQHARWAIIVLYIFGTIVVLSAGWTYGFEVHGPLNRVFRYVLRRMNISRLSVRALTLLSLSVPMYVVCIWMVEKVVRRGSERTWFLTSGQRFALGLGTFSLVETLWHTGRCVLKERRGDAFMDCPEVLGALSADEPYEEIPLRNTYGA